MTPESAATTAMPSPGACAYAGPSGTRCPGPADSAGGFCLWHDPNADKRGPAIKAQLEALVASGRSLEGFQLRGADLRAAHLTHRQKGKTVDFRDADLGRADLGGAHLFHIDLRGASLLKANLSGANLNHARLEGANLLGADLGGARIEQVDWGRHLMQEVQARAAEHAGKRFDAEQLFGEAEETYRAISLAVQERGHNNLAGHFYVKQMESRRMQMPHWSRPRLWSWIVDVICGYGERTDRVVAFSLLVVLGCAFAYFSFGVQAAWGRVGYSPDLGFRENLVEYLLCVYFSVITFTTAGYGDILPVGPIRTLAAAEAFTGAFSISLFVVVFVKRMTR